MSGAFRHDALNSRTLSGQDRAYPQAPLPVRAIVEGLASIESSWETAFRLFFCYRNPSPLDVVAVATMRDAVSEGLLTLAVEFVDHSPEPIGAFVQRGRGRRPSESAEHQAMKAWVERFLVGKGVRAVQEVSQLGYRVDVAAVADDVYVECGDTEPAKVLSFLESGRRIGILQYDSEDIVWFNPEAGLVQKLRERELLRISGR